MRSVFGCYLPEVTWCLKESWRQFDLLFICCAYMDSTWTAGFSSTRTTKIATFRGGSVQKGQAYVELEAMKMVMPLKAGATWAGSSRVRCKGR
jgi:hypothetical protein